MQVIYLVVWWVLCLQLGGHQLAQLGMCRKETKKQTKNKQNPPKLWSQLLFRCDSAGETYCINKVTNATATKDLPSVNPRNEGMGTTSEGKLMCQSYMIFWLLLKARNHPDQRNSVYRAKLHSLHINFFQLCDQNWQQKWTWVSSCSQSWSMLTYNPTESWLLFPFDRDSLQH